MGGTSVEPADIRDWAHDGYISEKTGDDDKPKDTFRSVSLFFLENCSAHGLPRIVSERSVFRKIIWGIIFVAALGYFSYTLETFVIEFLKYEVNVDTMLTSQ